MRRALAAARGLSLYSAGSGTASRTASRKLLLEARVARNRKQVDISQGVGRGGVKVANESKRRSWPP
jgi:hypothetical protein